MIKHPLNTSRITSILEFMKNAEQLKNTLRSAHTSQRRPESVAEHTWSICLLMMCFEDQLVDIDMLRLFKLIIIHDLGEAISGDIPATEQNPNEDKAKLERLDFINLCTPLPDDLKTEMLVFWDEYDAAETPEAVMAKGFDKIETMLQHLADGTTGNIDFPFNLNYGILRTDAHPLLKQIREIVDERTTARIPPN
ncbi:HD domain-containing protein [Lentilitoribacter sp. Alg239-R112]|uniref:HD domain-containing protein n=1 Tax=Lentilitoribacter sp. Alg239-R112 TaxID=2305987 RepID=UPI0013A6CA0B|nr:HD domain-containing protein [Lentilitoribacter sp. Alg239-R112]